MKLLFESFRKYVNEQNTEQEDLNTQVALKIARGGLQDVALGMSDDDLKDLVVYIYDKDFDETGEGWDPYDEDLAQIRDVLTPDDQEDREEYGLREAKKQEKKLKLSTTNIRKIFKQEGGALGMKALEDAIDAPKSEIKDVLDTMVDIRTHEHGDYIEDDDKEIDFKKVAETIREEVRMFLEKRKKRKKRKKKKKSKSKKKKSSSAGLDRCARIAKRKYDVWPSAYASGAAVKCRQGKIWKGVAE